MTHRVLCVDDVMIYHYFKLCIPSSLRYKYSSEADVVARAIPRAVANGAVAFGVHDDWGVQYYDSKAFDGAVGEASALQDNPNWNTYVYRAPKRQAAPLARCPGTGSCSDPATSGACCPSRPSSRTEDDCLGVSAKQTLARGCAAGTAVLRGHEAQGCQRLAPGQWVCPMASCPAAPGVMLAPGWSGSRCDRTPAAGKCSPTAVTAKIYSYAHGLALGDQIRCTGCVEGVCRQTELYDYTLN